MQPFMNLPTYVFCASLIQSIDSAQSMRMKERLSFPTFFGKYAASLHALRSFMKRRIRAGPILS